MSKRARAFGPALFAVMLAVGAMAAPVAQAAKPTKITICHAAGLADEPANWVTLSLPPNAVYGQNGASAHFNEQGTPLAGHEQDYLGPCEGDEEPPPDEFALCHANEDGTYSLVEGTAEELAEHESHEGDVDPDEAGGCPVPEEESFSVCIADEAGGYSLVEGLTEDELATALEGGAVLPDAEGACPSEETNTPPGDEVLPDRLDRPADDVQDERLDRPAVRGEALPFTGVDPTPFLALAGLLAASGTSALVISRTKK